MGLSPEEIELVERIAARLTSRDSAVYRAGGRAVALQAIEHRAELVKVLRGRITELGEGHLEERRQGYLEALLDVLVAAEAALEPREHEVRARRELAAMPVLQEVLDRAALAPLTPTETARALGKSAATGGRYLQQLRRLGLLAELPTRDGRERPHRVTPLGAQLARLTESARLAREQLDAVHDRVRAATNSGGNEGSLKQDPLTGVFLLDEFVKVLMRQVPLCLKAREPVSVMRLDIAGYRAFAASNDFAVVDECIIRFAFALKSEVPELAVIARYQPDKFVLLLPQFATAAATEFAQALRLKLPCTASVGIAGADAAEHVDAEILLEGSQVALLQAKAAGSGSLMTWTPNELPSQVTSQPPSFVHG